MRDSHQLSTLNLVRPAYLSLVVPGRVKEDYIPVHLTKQVGRQGLNVYRLIDGHRSIQDIAQIYKKPEDDVAKVIQFLQTKGCVQLQVQDDPEKRQDIANVPTMILRHQHLGLTG